MKHLITTAAVLALVPLAPALAQVPSTSGKTQATVTTQLPRTVRPTHYDLTVTPDAATLRFIGQVAITLDVLVPTPTITLNQADLSISRATITQAMGNPAALHIVQDNQAQTASFSAPLPLTPGRYVLRLDYSGKINTQANGLFALDYPEHGATKRALYTQFENSDARRFVPSWDEPFYKATFSLKAVVPAGQMAVSNLPVVARTPRSGDKELVTFGDSPRMSTYLLFFGLGDFERATRQVGATEIGLVTKRGDLPKGNFALDSAAAILPWYNDYFGTAFPLPKLDHVGAPGQSQFFGAMENWGAIFYFDYALLLDPKISSQTDRQGVFVTVAHEMAHQWFGDLVTMAWWDDLWLNEGFASWMQGRATQHFHPEWHEELNSLAGKNGAMNQDALPSTHPVIGHVQTVDQASQAFDAITYQKGEAVLVMLEGYTGATGWRDGVRAYMRRYAHGNTVTDDLWAEIEHASGKPITRIAHDFTRQPGVPLITASATCAGASTTVHFEQGEFTKDRPGKTPLHWQVPVATAALGGQPVQALVSGTGEVQVPGCGAVIVNHGQTAYFRTLYQPTMLAKIVRDFARVAPIDQLGMLNDAMALGLGGREPLADLLDLVAATPTDAAPQVITTALSNVSSLISPYSVGMPQRTAALNRLAAAKFLPILQRLGWQPVAGEPDTTANLREALITVLGDDGEPTVVAEANRRFASAQTDPAAIPDSLRRAILGVVAANADAATWDKLHAMARAETSTLAKASLFEQLGTAHDPRLADRALALAITDEPSATTSPGIIRAVSVRFPERAFDFAVANQKAVAARVDTTSATRFVPALIYNAYTPAALAKLAAWAKVNVQPDAMRSVNEAAAQIRYRMLVRDQRLPAVDRWLASHSY